MWLDCETLTLLIIRGDEILKFIDYKPVSPLQMLLWLIFVNLMQSGVLCEEGISANWAVDKSIRYFID